MKREKTGKINMKKRDYLIDKIEHFDIKEFNAIPLINQYEKCAFQARNIANAAKIYNQMLNDEDCTVIMCLAGSIFSAGLKKVIYDLVDNNLVDVIVSTGALIVDQDFFEALGFSHYQGSCKADDHKLMKLNIDRIYDHYIDEIELRECDFTISKIADSISPITCSSRYFIYEMGKYLESEGVKCDDSVVYSCYKKQVPIFVPAFSDCSAGFGLIFHQWEKEGKNCVSIDSVKDFLELTQIKIKSKNTGLLMIGGGVPKNFAQDITVAAEILGEECDMHKYAVQITVADERDGGLSGSTLQEAHSWGKVDNNAEQMVYCEATLALPILASYGYHMNKDTNRRSMCFNKLFKELISKL